MIPIIFGNSPELLLTIVAMRNAEDVARAQRENLVRTRLAKESGRRRWGVALRAWAHRSQHLPPTAAASRRIV